MFEAEMGETWSAPRASWALWRLGCRGRNETREGRFGGTNKLGRVPRKGPVRQRRRGRGRILLAKLGSLARESPAVRGISIAQPAKSTETAAGYLFRFQLCPFRKRTRIGETPDVTTLRDNIMMNQPGRAANARTRSRGIHATLGTSARGAVGLANSDATRHELFEHALGSARVRVCEQRL